MVEYENIILVPRGRAPFGQHQKLRPPGWPLGRSNSGISWFTQFLSLCACPRSTLTNLIGWEYETITLHAPTLAVCGELQTSDATERNEQCKRKREGSLAAPTSFNWRGKGRSPFVLGLGSIVSVVKRDAISQGTEKKNELYVQIVWRKRGQMRQILGNKLDYVEILLVEFVVASLGHLHYIARWKTNSRLFAWGKLERQ